MTIEVRREVMMTEVQINIIIVEMTAMTRRGEGKRIEGEMTTEEKDVIAVIMKTGRIDNIEIVTENGTEIMATRIANMRRTDQIEEIILTVGL